ncbi:adenylate/guanylate cyclase domain-containing protein [Argonema antarcticum]|uniref:adenylate/guanylate cyclase domain-containing protein n=1 Tax=Argonema antarcticum TaxID=2942763 RepID=UPI00201164D0|nr:adenylate/guanylate cyclase domain-containing protein [Argonema antarcticum]MCL1471997.1 HAMP domain-containing protein [Argonema antarcticum A004/B2]
MGWRLRLSIKSKLIAMLLVVSSCSILVTAYLGYQSGQANLTDRVFSQLISIRASKANQIGSYFQTLRNHLQTLGENPSVVTALQEFDTNYRQLETAQIPPTAVKKLASYYRDEFLPRLAKTEQGNPLWEFFQPKTDVARYLQYHYIAANPHPVGKKHLLDDAKDGSGYSRIHALYHPMFRQIIEKFGYYDLFLINPQGDIVYTVYKETDFVTNLTTGTYNESNLARLVSRVRQTKERNYSRLIDFESYAPSYGAPAAFIAMPIFKGAEFLGVLAVQLPVDEINNVMTGNQNWESDGLGKSGETYLVGQDYLMRSISRFLVEDREKYLQTLHSLRVSDNTLKRIQQYNTSILEQRVETIGVKEALAGKQNIQIIRDYRDIPVLSSYAPLKIDELAWVILSEIDLAEAYAPVYSFERRLLISATLLMLLVTVLAMALAYWFVKPINQLIASARQVAAGQLDIVASLQTRDEFGELARSFNDMVYSLRTQTNLIAEKNLENEQLLLSVFPAAIAKRLKRGEKNIAESVSNVAVLFSELTGFSKLSANLTAYEIVSILNDLVSSFDEAAERYGMEKIKTIGDSYMAVCGLSLPYLDHDKRAIDFALEMLLIVRRYNNERGFQLNIRIGINSGSVVAGIVGRNKFIYDVWGDTIDIANALRGACPPGAVLVSEGVYQRLEDLYEFVPYGNEINGKTKPSAWCLKSVQAPQNSEVTR